MPAPLATVEGAGIFLANLGPGSHGPFLCGATALRWSPGLASPGQAARARNHPGLDERRVGAYAPGPGLLADRRGRYRAFRLPPWLNLPSGAGPVKGSASISAGSCIGVIDGAVAAPAAAGEPLVGRVERGQVAARGFELRPQGAQTLVIRLRRLTVERDAGVTAPVQEPPYESPSLVLRRYPIAEASQDRSPGRSGLDSRAAATTAAGTRRTVRRLAR